MDYGLSFIQFNNLLLPIDKFCDMLFIGEAIFVHMFIKNTRVNTIKFFLTEDVHLSNKVYTSTKIYLLVCTSQIRYAINP